MVREKRRNSNSLIGRLNNNVKEGLSYYREKREATTWGNHGVAGLTSTLPGGDHHAGTGGGGYSLLSLLGSKPGGGKSRIFGSSLIGVRILEARLLGNYSKRRLTPWLHCEVTVDGQQRQTRKVKSETPRWESFLVFEVRHPELKTVTATIVATGLGTKVCGKTSQGVVKWQLEDENAVCPPKWVKLKGVDGEETSDELLIEIVVRDRYKGSSQLRIFAGTWNMALCHPDHDLREWLKTDNCDIIVVGVQECGYKPRMPAKTCAEDLWLTVHRQIGDMYFFMAAISMGKIRMAVYVRCDAMLYVDGIQTACEATGIGGVYTNKGGVAIVMRIADTSICFVNSHQAAHQQKVKERNEDFRDVMAGLKLGFPGMEITTQFNHVIWVGDLNYRLNLTEEQRVPSPSEFEMVCALAKAREYPELLRHDQLRRAVFQEKGGAFFNFQEGDIHFAPTFKINKGQVESWDPHRLPAYTDRILWHSMKGAVDSIKQLRYYSASTVTSSDHKPVAAEFRVKVNKTPLLGAGRQPKIPRMKTPAPTSGRINFSTSIHTPYSTNTHASLERRKSSLDWGKWRRPSVTAEEGGEAEGTGFLSMLCSWAKGIIPQGSSSVRAHSRGIWALQLSELRGEDILLGTGAVPDPYVVFLGHNMQKEVRTSTVDRSSSPTWPIYRTAPLMLPLTAPYESAILNSIMMVYIKNDNRKNEYLGSGSISLSDLVQHRVNDENTAWEFKIPISRYGSPAGKLIGAMTLVRVDKKESWFSTSLIVRHRKSEMPSTQLKRRSSICKATATPFHSNG